MTGKSTWESKHLLSWVDGTVAGEPLSLENESHIRTLKQKVKETNVDLVIIDTVSAAFNLRNENDNSEVKSRVMGPLVHLARSCNCAVIFVHHHGKPNENKGEKAY